MSRTHDKWEKLVEAVLRREKDRQLALFKSSSSSDFSSRPSFDSDVSDDPCSQSISILHHAAVAIRFDVINEATKIFRPDLFLGEGIYGSVYKGMIHEHPLTAAKLQSGILVAVKKLNFKRLAGLQECLEEINHLSELPHHPNVVKLVGYCFEAENTILVYEFIRRGGLDCHLFTRGNQSIPWETRLKVALGAGRGLAFLHASEILIPYRDFKSYNIILDGEFNAKLSDYGLAGLADTGSLQTSDELPEYPATGRLYAKSNVFSFGVVLLELLTGRRAYDISHPKKEQMLVDFAKPNLGSQKKVSRIMDSRLEGRYPREEVYKVGKLASRCLSQMPGDRPTMSEVVAALEQICK